MMYKALGGTGEISYGLSRSTVKFQGHRGRRKIDDLFPISEFLDDNSNLNSWMAMK